MVHGPVGYLREAYGGGEPYATRYLVSEAFYQRRARVFFSPMRLDKFVWINLTFRPLGGLRVGIR